MELARDYFEQNLTLLREHHPMTWEKVTAYAGKPLGEFRPAGNGKLNLAVRNENGEEVILHDPSDPEAELTGFFSLVPETSTGVVFFVGMGLGYSPLAMIRSRAKIRHLAILEPDMGIFVQALHALDLAPLLSDRRVVIAVGPDIDVPSVMEPMGRALLLESIHILNHVPSSRVHPKTCQSLYDEIYKHGNTFNIGGNTTRAFGRKFIENRLRHLTAIHHQWLLEHILDAFTGVPAIIIAGGPSLNKNIRLLPEARGKAVMIAVDTVLPALLANGVAPDFTTTIDMEDIVVEKIIDVSAAAADTSLVCASWVSPTIPKNFPCHQVYWTFAARTMEQWLNTLLGGKLLTSGAGTVAHLSFTVAYLLGCSPIIFVGQDLAFTGRQDHAQHTSLTSKNLLEQFYATNEIIWTDGYGGLKVPTTRAWLSDKSHFEHLISTAADRIFVNATEGGVRLEGTEEIPLEEALARYCRKDINVSGIIGNSECHGKMANRRRMIDDFDRLLKIISGAERDMGRLVSVTENIVREISKLQEQGSACQGFDSLPLALQRQIQELDALNSRLDKTPIWKLLDEVTLDGLLQSERLHHEIKQLEGCADRYLEWLRKHVERMAYINQYRPQVLTPFRDQLKRLREHLQQEHRLLKRLARQNENSREIILELLRLYYDNGDHVLMEKLITSRCPNPENSAELSFYLGAVAAHQSQFEKAEQHFARAVAVDSSWSVSVAECRSRLGDEYLRFGREWKTNDQDVARRMLFKGMRHCPDHPELRKALTGQITQVLADAEAAAGRESLVEMENRLAVWCREIANNAGLAGIIEPEQAASLYRYYGNIQVARQEYGKALDAFAAAIALTPRAPDLHLLHSDAAFAQDDYATGVASLDKAVALDHRYAQYWENIGDNLSQTGQMQDAIEAYTRRLLATPEQFGVLKKIGDCYLAMDQPQAALEAYKYLKTKMQSAVDEG